MSAADHPRGGRRLQAAEGQEDLDPGVADEMKADDLYAAFASVPEMGGRDYLLLLTKSKAKRRSRRSAWSKG